MGLAFEPSCSVATASHASHAVGTADLIISDNLWRTSHTALPSTISVDTARSPWDHFLSHHPLVTCSISAVEEVVVHLHCSVHLADFEVAAVLITSLPNFPFSIRILITVTKSTLLHVGIFWAIHILPYSSSMTNQVLTKDDHGSHCPQLTCLVLGHHQFLEQVGADTLISPTPLGVQHSRTPDTHILGLLDWVGANLIFAPTVRGWCSTFLCICIPLSLLDKLEQHHSLVIFGDQQPALLPCSAGSGCCQVKAHGLHHVSAHAILDAP
ncbi:hypothetical protein C8R45DRAFT_987998 [Mycena sanguinolenta]|nr:hypothetical protein C8R45DRAFT_987998 [Mycena sanguinolenta]